MSEENPRPPLTNDQEQQVKNILERIRSGLQTLPNSTFVEPAHIFSPRTFNVNE